MTDRDQGLWRNRDFALLVGGTTVNGIGDWLLELALPLFIFLETGSGIATAAVYIVRLFVGVLFGPLGGSLADQWRLRTTLVSTNLLQVGALLPLLLVTSERLWPVFVVVVLQGLISSVNDPAGFALLPRIVDASRLVQANSAMSAGGSISRLVGAAAGGIAVAAGGIVGVAIADALTFVLAGLAAMLMSQRADQRPAGDDAVSRDASVRAGIREVRSRPTIGAVLSIQGLAMFGFGLFPVLFIAFVTDYLGGGGTEVGVIRASSAFGGLVAAGLIAGLASRIRPPVLMSAGYLMFAFVAFLFVNAPPITTEIWVYLTLFALTGLPNVASQVGTTSTLQELAPSDVLGRIGGLTSSVSALGIGAGSLTAGLLLGVYTARTLFNVQVALLLLCGLMGVFLVARPMSRSQAN